MTRTILNTTRLVEEVPGVEENERYYIWSGTERKTVWKGPTLQAGKDWAEANGIVIEEIEAFEP